MLALAIVLCLTNLRALWLSLETWAPSNYGLMAVNRRGAQMQVRRYRKLASIRLLSHDTIKPLDTYNYFDVFLRFSMFKLGCG